MVSNNSDPTAEGSRGIIFGSDKLPVIFTGIDTRVPAVIRRSNGIFFTTRSTVFKGATRTFIQQFFSYKVNITLAGYFLYLILDVTHILWVRGIWFSENDVLHIGLIIWMIYIAVILANRIVDTPTADSAEEVNNRPRSRT